MLRALVACCLLVSGLAATAWIPTAAVAATGVPLPALPALPKGIEPQPSYQGAQLCDPVARKGPKKLQALLTATYGTTAYGITRSCTGTKGTSEHMEGRALDWMISGKAQRKDAKAFLAWLLAPDAQGHQQAIARRMGLMYIVWNNKMFRMYDPGRGWAEYNNCSSTLSAAYDTTCHRNHVHFSFTWDGAAAETSFWSGKAVKAPSCPRLGSAATAPPVTKSGQEFVALPPARILDTAAGVGVAARCRLSQDNYAGEGRRIDLQVTGVGGVPATGVSAVVLSLQVWSPNAPTKLLIEPTGSAWKRLRASTTGMEVDGLGAVTVPVGSNGRVSLTLTTGAADVTADVLGYYRAPGEGTLLFHPSDPERIVDTRASGGPLAPGEARVVDVAGLGGLPQGGVAAVALTATLSAGSSKGGLTVFDPDDPPPAADVTSIRARAHSLQTNLVIARVSSVGTVTIRNDSSGTRHVRLDVAGWWAPATTEGGSRFMVLKPRKVINTLTGKGVSGRLTSGRVVSADLAGVGRLPTDGVTAVALQATMVGFTKGGALVAWRSGQTQPDTRAASPRKGSDHTAFVVTPLAEGSTDLAASKGGFDLRAYYVGYWYQP